MAGNKDKTVSKRAPTTTEIDFAKLAKDLDSDHEYHLTKTTTETYKLTKSASKSKGKQVEAARSRRHSSPSQPSSSKATPPRKLLSPPETPFEILDRLVKQFNDRATQEPSSAGYTAWRDLVADVYYLRHNYIYIQSPAARQQASSQLVVDLEGVLHEAEFGSDVLRDFQSLRAGASRGASSEALQDIRKGFLRSWGKTVRKWWRWLDGLVFEREKELADMMADPYGEKRRKLQEELKEQEKLKQEEKQKQEEKDQAKKVRFESLGTSS